MKLKYMFVLSLIASSSSFAQDCVENQPLSQEAGQFIDRKDGTILDVSTNLLWQKCNVGETYNTDSNTCSGSPTSAINWTSALTNENVGVDGFRLPNIKELGSIVNYQCAKPAIDLAFFPSTINVPYWTSTPDAQGLNSGYSGLIIDFTEGQEVTANSSGIMLLRLVKDFNQTTN
ncbi:DUF1566 domain-containing protein [Vibrio sp. D404a]|uniref:Lcl C-terminal domain-containing protein n=1 Tax=unclassified Vibrio TaxID=2614977 RepID=UPI002556F30F|nr:MULTISPECIES: DUF1566 domain-containing protein [unclassified Vibrio]MDK9740156.1 DUF1566 domain-containing protein [Vibrio sp. D404a]MDK9799277.1 DUF1566 domain-containing protein [Vibrio sp. D449a]